MNDTIIITPRQLQLICNSDRYLVTDDSINQADVYYEDDNTAILRLSSSGGTDAEFILPEDTEIEVYGCQITIPAVRQYFRNPEHHRDFTMDLTLNVYEAVENIEIPCL